MSAPPDSNRTLSEKYIQDCFHSYLRSSLTQAKAERILDVDVLSSAESDLMITGPALCLYFAALRSTTNPPSVPLPRKEKNLPPIELSPLNCPPAFLGFLRVWTAHVQQIQSLTPEHQHDLARIICGLAPVSSPLNVNLNRIAADLRAVAIEISQRRSFQDKYNEDLQAAIDAGDSTRGRTKASFAPPPAYTPSPSPSPQGSPRKRPEPLSVHPPHPSEAANPALLSPPPTSTSAHFHHSSAASSPSTPSSTSSFSRSPSPSLLADSPTISVIRETLYAALGDVLSRVPSLGRLMKTDPPRAYFAAVGFAILEVSTTSITADGSVVGVLGSVVTLDDCPPPLRPFMTELAAIGHAAKEMEEQDDAHAIELAQVGREVPEPRLERVRQMLEKGVGFRVRNGEAEDEGRRSTEGRAVAFTNRINALALGMTRLRPFRERQDEVFKVLSGIMQR
ncbi:hypothetical protein PUNSTDRAFT_102136 [Punctularia strigosozonata HHB-11173 SS5]|uniref:uncharacterized protein n=1 Tax=Punctularia strigosozonata (strain HHB-11173) TaxID=741275 RepID=UPI0004417FF1|nr:uncharacterized protein PUNSTDRAFT_102136 [Punctularia strigosozonata HHB-11173 SS5]EIN10117.1 hypothetical protein PUNSTDRAFT_102136 [Punctularia strigosozonata HHB-11173 SS5]